IISAKSMSDFLIDLETKNNISVELVAGEMFEATNLVIEIELDNEQDI
ncbi:7298_t:CDS:1, partial [Racocetra fulgida]